MYTSLDHIKASDWQTQFEDRATRSIHWLTSVTKEISLAQRRTIVRHIKEGMAEATTHHDINYGAEQIRDSLIFALWAYIPQETAQTAYARHKIEDFAMFAATNAPAHQKTIQETLWEIVPEDRPTQEKTAAEIAAKILSHNSCLGE